jgi:hypothetical protein
MDARALVAVVTRIAIRLAEINIALHAAMHTQRPSRVVRYRSVGAENRSMSGVPRKRRKVRALASVARWHGRREPLRQSRYDGCAALPRLRWSEALRR